MNKINLDTVLMGSDPEVFILDTKSGKIVSAIGQIPGDKDRPHKISDDGHAIQIDNVMAEFCIPASNNPDKIYDDIQFCIADINNRLKENNEVIIIASAYLEDEYLQNKIAQTFGWTQPIN